jgi:phage protein U
MVITNSEPQTYDALRVMVFQVYYYQPNSMTHKEIELVRSYGHSAILKISRVKEDKMTPVNPAGISLLVSYA